MSCSFAKLHRSSDAETKPKTSKTDYLHRPSINKPSEPLKGHIVAANRQRINDYMIVDRVTSEVSIRWWWCRGRSRRLRYVRVSPSGLIVLRHKYLQTLLIEEGQPTPAWKHTSGSCQPDPSSSKGNNACTLVHRNEGRRSRHRRSGWKNHHKHTPR